MQELIEIGIKQGTLLKFPENTTVKSEAFLALSPLIQNGRFGDSQNKSVAVGSLFVVLTQDCSIANQSKYIELAQLKKCKVKDESRVENLLLGKDYNKLLLKVQENYFELEEVMITKVKKQDLFCAIQSNHIKASNTLSIRDKKIILDWRLLAYFREPFPHKFNQILFTYLNDSKYWFTNFLLEHQQNIHSIRIYITPEDDENADEYQLALCALLTTSGESHQDLIQENIEGMLHELGKYEGMACLQTVDLATEDIEIPEHLLLSLTATLDEFSFANAYVMREFNFQYLCY